MRRIVVTGNSSCGKTNLLRLSQGLPLKASHIATIEDTFEIKNVTFVDSAGSEAFDRLRPMSYSNASGAIICYDSSCKESRLNVIDKWIPEARYYGITEIYVVALKCELGGEEGLDDGDLDLISAVGLQYVSGADPSSAVSALDTIILHNATLEKPNLYTTTSPNRTSLDDVPLPFVRIAPFTSRFDSKFDLKQDELKEEGSDNSKFDTIYDDLNLNQITNIGEVTRKEEKKKSYDDSNPNQITNIGEVKKKEEKKKSIQRSMSTFDMSSESKKRSSMFGNLFGKKEHSKRVSSLNKEYRMSLPRSTPKKDQKPTNSTATFFRRLFL